MARGDRFNICGVNVCSQKLREVEIGLRHTINRYLVHYSLYRGDTV